MKLATLRSSSTKRMRIQAYEYDRTPTSTAHGMPGWAPGGAHPAPRSVHFEYENLGARGFVLRYRHKVSIQFRNQARSLPKRTGRNLSEQFVVVWISLLVHIYASVTGGINSFTCDVVLHIIHPLCNWQGSNLFPTFSVQHRNLTVPARYKQSVVGF